MVLAYRDVLWLCFFAGSRLVIPGQKNHWWGRELRNENDSTRRSSGYPRGSMYPIIRSPVKGIY